MKPRWAVERKLSAGFGAQHGVVVHQDRRFWLGVLFSGAVIAAAAGISLGVLTLAGVTFEGADRKQSQASERVEGLLLTANRGRLAICVQAVGTDANVQTEAKSLIEALLPELQKHPQWVPAGLAVGSPVVNIGCPSDPELLRPGADLGAGIGPNMAGKEADPYRLFVFILLQGEIDRLFAGWPYRNVPQELMCVGHVCPEVTTGLYLSPEEILLESFLKESLVKGIGLEPAVPYESASGTSASDPPRPPGVTICVQAVGVDAAIEPVGDKAIEAALVEAAKHPGWAATSRGAASPVVDSGCPSEPLVGRSGVAWKDGIPLGAIDRKTAVSQESHYELFIFVMPVTEIHRLLGGLSKRHAPQEFICESDLCVGVTTALYLSPEEIANGDFLVDRLLEGIGLDPFKQ